MTILMTSLAEIRSFYPCPVGWKNILAAHMNKETGEYDSEKQFPLVECVESNSISDVCWLIWKRKKEIQICVLFAKMCADSVQYLNNSHSHKSAAYADYAADVADYAAAAADAAAYAADYAAAYADAAAYVADAADAANAAYVTQKQKNKQFLIQCINEFIAD